MMIISGGLTLINTIIGTSNLKLPDGWRKNPDDLWRFENTRTI